MVLAGIREMPAPRAAGKGLVVFVEIDRCATDAIQALMGVRSAVTVALLALL